MHSLEQLRYPIGQCLYSDHYSSEQLDVFFRRIEMFPKQLELAVQSLLEFQLQTPYREGGWTISQVIHHCAESHMNAVIRIKLTLTEEQPVIKPYREDLWCELPDMDLPFNNSITLLYAVHEKILALLRNSSAEDLQRTYYHPQYERNFRLSDLLCLYAWHGEHHLAHISGLKERMGWE